MKESVKKKYKLGLALSGGGAKGFAHIGVFKLLEECGIRPDIIVGTSAGALMGTLFADGYTADEIKLMFNGREFSEFAKLQIPKAGLFDSKPFSHFVKRHLRAKSFEELKIPMIVMATDLDNGCGHAFSSGPLVEPIRASCSIPIIFNPVIIDGTHFVDGGLFHNFPVSIIRDLCDVVIGVNVNPFIPHSYNQNLYSIAERSYHYLFQANMAEDRALCDLLIETEEFGQYKLFDLKNVNLIAHVGYTAAVNSFQALVTTSSKNDILIHGFSNKKTSQPDMHHGKK